MNSEIYLHCGDIFARKSIGSVRDKKTCFTDGTEKQKEKTYLKF